jgi:hypothetical protein
MKGLKKQRRIQIISLAAVAMAASFAALAGSIHQAMKSVPFFGVLGGRPNLSQ